MTEGNFARDRLKAFVERVERLEEEKAALSADIKEVMAEAKAEGFSIKTMKAVIKLRKMDKGDRDEQFALIDLYMDALGMSPREERNAELREGEAAVPEVDPPYLVRALDLVEEHGQGKLTAKDGGGGIVEVIKAKGARGALGSAFDVVHTKLVENGFTPLAENRYSAPPDLMPQEPPEAPPETPDPEG